MGLPAQPQLTLFAALGFGPNAASNLFGATRSPRNRLVGGDRREEAGKHHNYHEQEGHHRVMHVVASAFFGERIHQPLQYRLSLPRGPSHLGITS